MRRTLGQRAPVMVLILIAGLTLAAALVVNAFVRDQQRSRFEREAAVYTQALQDRLSVYERLLNTMRASWQAQGPAQDEASFSRFVEGIDLASRYPGVQAVGYGQAVLAADTAALEQERRRAGSPDFRVTQGSDPHPERIVISLIAPPSPENLAALGFDMNSERLRHQGFLAARARELAQATDLLDLAQLDPSGRPLRGFLVMLPYRSDPRNPAPDGYLYLAVRADTFLQDLSPLQSGATLRTQALLDGQSLQLEPPSLTGLPFRYTSTLSIAGQQWTLNHGADADFGRDFASTIPLLIVLVGLGTAGVAFLLVKAQVDARTRAENLNVSLAQARTRQEQARAEFEAIFQSMQDAAAFTDEGGRIRMVNRALTEQFRAGPDSLNGQLLGVIHRDRRLDNRSTFQALTTTFERLDGSSFQGETQRGEVRSPDGALLGLLETIRDVTDRVQAERALLAGERRSRGILDAIPHMIRVSRTDGQVTFTNGQFSAQLGPQGLHAQLDAAGRAAYSQMLREAEESGDGAQCEVQLHLPGGPRWAVLKLVPIRDEHGQISEWVTSATDIHDRVTAERLAQRNEQRYRGVIEGMPQIVWLTDPIGTPVYFNRRWNEFVGTARSGSGFLGLLHPEDRADYSRRWADALRSARPFEAEHRLLRQDGQYRTFVTRGLPVRDTTGRIIEWVGTSTDVDDSVYAENAARLLADVTEQLNARSVNAAPLRHDRYRAALGRLSSRFADSAALWSVHPTTLLATSSPSATWHAAAFQVVAGQAIERILDTEDPVFIDADPALHRVNATGALFYPLIGRDGTLVGVLGLLYRQALTNRDQDLAQDLAQRFTSALSNDLLQERVNAAQADLHQLNQSLEDRVQRRTLELEAANRELEAFSYSVSHDLRTPLRHIVGFGDLLHKETGEALSPKGQRYLKVIMDSAGRMSQLIDDLLSFSRMGRQELRRVPVNLRALIGSAWAGLEPDRAGRNVTLHLPDDLPGVSADQNLLELVFTNLLSNAVKYSRGREEAHVWISAGQTPDAVTVTVRDNGVGFDPRYVDKLFGVFQRLHRADEFEGIGIGLANVRRIINRHGGQVSADAVPGEGATFTVTLPTHPEDA
ncbi:histidine kinase [Deinococcus seoulensis]|uniref:histidine kinase n=1 Tax=Deinococcus seoulensis TaxID=1837379 RepID=A0ABQ2RNE3_9DEIO|nr:PAS domain S-box protein [Deinococcus seoulensis]GGR44448.1 histidine kinase [Deinococcus seoulensis]